LKSPVEAHLSWFSISSILCSRSIIPKSSQTSRLLMIIIDLCLLFSYFSFNISRSFARTIPDTQSVQGGRETTCWYWSIFDIFAQLCLFFFLFFQIQWTSKCLYWFIFLSIYIYIYIYISSIFRLVGGEHIDYWNYYYRDIIDKWLSICHRYHCSACSRCSYCCCSSSSYIIIIHIIFYVSVDRLLGFVFFC